MTAALLAAPVLSGCGGAAQPAPARAAPVRAERPRLLLTEGFRFRAALYHREPPRTDASAAVERLAQRAGFDIFGSKAVLSGRTQVLLLTPPIEDFTPPDAEFLVSFGRGLSAEDRRAVAASEAVTVIEIAGPGQRAAEDYPKALALVAELARELGGYVSDEETRLVYTLESFREMSGGFVSGVPTGLRHVSVHLYRDEELIRIVTLGMIKFGLPDIAVEDVAGSSANAMGSLVNLICQTLIERPELYPSGKLQVTVETLRNSYAKQEFSRSAFDNAALKLEVKLAPARPERGDADNRLLELVFEGSERERQQRHAAALSALFGSSDSVSFTEHDEQLLAASARAKTKAFALRERFAKGAPTNEMLTVKAGFATPDGNREWMWVEVVSWKEGVIHGILNSDPFLVPTLEAGARVEVSADEIFDYLWTRADGTTEGNETGAILQARETAR